DTGAAFFGGPSIYNPNEINPRLGNGGTIMIGKQVGDYAIEASGFYISQSSSSKVLESKGSINMPYANAPLGFEGDNGMFLQGDVLRANLKNTLGSAELVCR